MTLPLGLPWYSLAGPVLVSGLLCALVIRFGIVDAPDGGRKTQARPVPNAGGIAILLTMGGFLALASFEDDLSVYWVQNGAGAVFLLAAIAGLIGLFDDIWSMPAGRKMGLLVGIALLAGIYGPSLSGFDIPLSAAGKLTLPAILSAGGVALWLFVMMNAANFMDGSNGLSLGSGAIALAVCVLLLVRQETDPFDLQADMAVICLFGALSTVGFLVWNLGGRLYAGDCGALALGALLGGSGVIIAENHSVWVPPMLVLPFLVDVFLTLTWRAGRGESLLRAHRDHAYQLLIRSGWTHLRVALLWWAMTAVCGVVALLVPAASAGIAFVVLLAAGSGLWIWQRLTLGRTVGAGASQ